MSWREIYSQILEAHRDLSGLTTFKVGGEALSFLRPRSAEELAELYAALAQAGRSFRLLGGGANVLVEDGLHEIPFIHLDRLTTKAALADDVLAVEAGYPFLKLVSETVRDGWSGLESLAGIPGQMGGICAMNAGGRWGEIKDFIVWVDVATDSGEILRLKPADCHFGYRKSNMGGLVTRVGLGLERSKDVAATQACLAANLKAKGATQPLRVPSGGCCFANPPGQSVGRIVEELGLKGHRCGDAQISEIHGNFIVNRGRARFEDVLALIEQIEQAVKAERGISLRRELKIWRK